MPGRTLFQEIIDGKVPCHRIYEDDEVVAFLDARPLSPGHALVVPKEAARTIDELSEASAAALGRVLPKLARAIMRATGTREYNILQNNGPRAHQAVDHVHFHIIPKPDATRGLSIGWPAKELLPSEGEAMSRRIQRELAPKAA